MKKRDFGLDILTEEKNDPEIAQLFELRLKDVKRNYGVVLHFTNKESQKTTVHYQFDVMYIDPVSYTHLTLPTIYSV